MVNVRVPAVAGIFYPDDPRALKAAVDACLAAANVVRSMPKAVIVPHAGYIYSGPIAGTAYACLAPQRGRIERVVLLGPAHRVGFSGLGLSSAAYFQTPLGRVAVDSSAQVALRGLSQIGVHDAAHAGEHSLEVQLPFLQQALGDFKLVPIAVGAARAVDVAQALQRLWGAAETLIVVSSDLSHYHDYATAQRLDRATSNAIEALDADAITYEHACGRDPIAGLLYVAREKGLRARTIDLRNSGDTAGPRDGVVGYGAYVFE